jgi:hypothetical protein
MCHQILLVVALQQWDEFSPHAVAAREASVALARGSGAKLLVLSVYAYGPLEGPGLPLEMARHGGAEVVRQLEAARFSRRTRSLQGSPMCHARHPCRVPAARLRPRGCPREAPSGGGSKERVVKYPSAVWILASQSGYTTPLQALSWLY